MVCKCGETGVFNEVLGQAFYYCRTCKIEIPLDVVDSEEEQLMFDWESAVTGDPEADFVLDYWTDNGDNGDMA